MGSFLPYREPNMDLLFAIGQAIALAALAYGAILCFRWRDEYDPDAPRPKPRATRQAPRAIASHAQYVAAAETDPAS
jgi:hypothetical protein